MNGALNGTDEKYENVTDYINQYSSSFRPNCQTCLYTNGVFYLSSSTQPHKHFH